MARHVRSNVSDAGIHSIRNPANCQARCRGTVRRFSAARTAVLDEVEELVVRDSSAIIQSYSSDDDDDGVDA